MPKVKAHITQTVAKGFANIAGRRLPMYQSDVTFREVRGQTIMSLKPKSGRKSSPAQQFMRWLWCVVDQMYRGFTLGQFNYWKRYYWWARYKGLTKKASAERATKTKIWGYRGNIGYYAFFMKQGLRQSLSQYFTDYLKAQWRISKRYKDGDELVVEAEICYQPHVWIPREPRELKLERVRW